MNWLEDNRTTIGIVGLLTLCGGVLRYLGTQNHSLWVDETYSLVFASRPLGELVRLVMEYDVHPPIYYTLLRLWAQLFGYSQFSLRMLSVLFGTLSIPLFYLLAREFFRRRGAVVATLAFTLSSYAILFSGEIRMYAFLLFLSILSYYSFLRFLRTPSRAYQSVYFISSLLLMYTHIMGLTVIAAQFVQYLARQWRIRSPNEAKTWGKLQVGLGLSFIPWIVIVVQQASKLAEKTQRPLPGLYELVTLQYNLSGGVVPVIVFGTLSAIGVGRWIWGRGQEASFELGVLARHWLDELGTDSGNHPTALAWFAVPIALQFGFAYIIPRTFDYRHMIMCLVPLLLLVTYGVVSLGVVSFGRLRGRHLRTVAVLLLVVSSSIAVADQLTTHKGPEWEEGTQYVEQHAQSGAVIVFDSELIQRQFTYYSDAESQYELYGYPDASPLIPRQQQWPGVETAGVDNEIWLLASHSSHEDQFISAMNDTHILTTERNFDGLYIYRFESR